MLSWAFDAATLHPLFPNFRCDRLPFVFDGTLTTAPLNSVLMLLPAPSVLLMASSLPDAFSGIMVSSLESSEPLCLFGSALIVVGPKILLLHGMIPDRLRTSAIFTFPDSFNMFRTQCCHKFAEFCRAKGIRITSHTPSRMARITTSSSCCFVAESSLLLLSLLLFSFSSLVVAVTLAATLAVVISALLLLSLLLSLSDCEPALLVLLLLSPSSATFAAGEDVDVK